MERPEKVFLDEPIKLYGIEIKHTEEGCRYYQHHFQIVLDLAIADGRIQDKDIPHARQRIEEFKLYIQLYERTRGAQPGTEKL